MAEFIQGEHMKKVLITAGLALASCGAFVALAQQSTLTIWVLNDIAPLFKEVAADFEKANPNVTITVRDYPNEAYKTAVQVGVASNQPPDIFYNDPGEASFKFVRDGLAKIAAADATAPKAPATGNTRSSPRTHENRQSKRAPRASKGAR